MSERRLYELRLRLEDFENLVEDLDKKLAKTPRLDYFLPYTLAVSGRRLGEVLRLTTVDVHENEGTVTWHIEKKRGEYPLTLPMPRRWFIHYSNYVLANKITYEVFSVSPVTAWRIVRRVTGFKPHDLRHLFALEALIRTRDIELVRRWLAHSDYDMVNYYVKVVGLEVRSHPFEQ